MPIRTTVYQLVELRDVTVEDLTWDDVCECYYINHRGVEYSLNSEFLPINKISFSLLLIDNPKHDNIGEAVIRVVKTC